MATVGVKGLTVHIVHYLSFCLCSTVTEGVVSDGLDEGWQLKFKIDDRYVTSSPPSSLQDWLFALPNYVSIQHVLLSFLARFYRAMHFSAKRGIAIACRLPLRLSVTLVNCDHIGWNSSKLISPLVSLGCSLFAIPT